MSPRTKQLKIDPDMLIIELTERYPLAADFLINEYEFHCIGCIMAGFETIRQGAVAHGIFDNDFDEMILRLEKYLTDNQRESS
jgi:hybrid cluster-associated redox disulfide protein